MSDAELVSALVEGRPEAFRLAWDRFSPLVYGVLRHALGHDEVEDAQQEVFSCLFRRVGTLRDPLALRPFVLAITLNTVKYERRRRSRRARIVLMAEPSQLNLAGGDQPATNLAFARFARLLRKLAERERRSFVLRFIEGMTVTQIAKEMRISEPTVRRSFSRAWARMRKWAARDPFLNDYLQDGRLVPPGDDVEETSERQARDDAGGLLDLAEASPPKSCVRFVAPSSGAQIVELPVHWVGDTSAAGAARVRLEAR